MSFSNPQQGYADQAKALRREAGAWLKTLREKADLTQNDLAKTLGFEYYTMISQVERGTTRIPPDKMQQWAEAVKVDPQEFVQHLMRFYDPYSWQILFGGRKHPVK